jgi:hypothetical protein
MTPQLQSPPHRLLRVIFVLFLASGVMVGACFAWALADWIRPQGEGAFGLFFLGAVSFVPVLLGWLAGGAYLLLVSRDGDVRLGVALASAHLVWWLVVIGIGAWGKAPSLGWGERIVTTVEPGLYAIGVTLLAARWFWRRRGDAAVQAAA